MVENGQFESRAENITVIPELQYNREDQRADHHEARVSGQVRQDPIKIPWTTRHDDGAR